MTYLVLTMVSDIKNRWIYLGGFITEPQDSTEIGCSSETLYLRLNVA